MPLYYLHLSAYQSLFEVRIKIQNKAEVSMKQYGIIYFLKAFVISFSYDGVFFRNLFFHLLRGKY